MIKRKTEKNVGVFNKDVRELGGYAYTNLIIYSARVASEKQSNEIIRMVKLFTRKKKSITILDVGSGDGTYTFELFERLRPKMIVGFDFASDGVKMARKRTSRKLAGKITFVESSIYDVNRKIKKKI